jgi:hypothetical protein
MLKSLVFCCCFDNRSALYLPVDKEGSRIDVLFNHTTTTATDELPSPSPSSPPRFHSPAAVTESNMRVAFDRISGHGDSISFQNLVDLLGKDSFHII